jgi:hypothetical protein
LRALGVSVEPPPLRSLLHVVEAVADTDEGSLFVLKGVTVRTRVHWHARCSLCGTSGARVEQRAVLGDSEVEGRTHKGEVNSQTIDGNTR